MSILDCILKIADSKAINDIPNGMFNDAIFILPIKQIDRNPLDRLQQMLMVHQSDRFDLVALRQLQLLAQKWRRKRQPQRQQ